MKHFNLLLLLLLLQPADLLRHSNQLCGCVACRISLADAATGDAVLSSHSSDCCSAMRRQKQRDQLLTRADSHIMSIRLRSLSFNIGFAHSAVMIACRYVNSTASAVAATRSLHCSTSLSQLVTSDCIQSAHCYMCLMLCCG